MKVLAGIGLACVLFLIMLEPVNMGVARAIFTVTRSAGWPEFIGLMYYLGFLLSPLLFMRVLTRRWKRKTAVVR